MAFGSLALLWMNLVFAGAPSVNVGAPALQFVLPAVNEQLAMDLVNKPTVALSDFAGLDPAYPRKGVVLYFCTRAKGGDALPELERVAKKARGKGVQIVVVLADKGEIADLSEWVTQQAVSFPVLRDNQRVVSDRYGISEWPLTFVVDSEGEVYAVGTPKAGEIEIELTAAVDALTGGR